MKISSFQSTAATRFSSQPLMDFLRESLPSNILIQQETVELRKLFFLYFSARNLCCFHDEPTYIYNHFIQEIKNNPFFCYFSVDMLGSVFQAGPEDEWHPDLVYVAVCGSDGDGELLLNKYLRKKFIKSRAMRDALQDL
jgi:hypothetical protein